MPARGKDMPARGRISPWIENLIASYGSDEGTSGGHLKAHVIGVGHMSQSQAQGSEGPTGLLFLSDEQVQIPAVLTASAWEDLQEEEDRECFSSLLSSTMCIQDYSLLFHMAPEQTRCRFFLSVGKLATIAVGTKNNTPCCTSLPSVQVKICQTWRAMLGQEDSQKSQTGLNLTDLLGEWQHDCLMAELDHIREKLSTVTPQPSTSTLIPTVTLPDTCTTTSWDMDRVRYKGLESFTIPIQQLLIPDSLGQLQLQPQSASSVSEADRHTFAVTARSQASVEPEDTTGQQHASGSSPIPQEDPPVVLSGSDISPMSNPWDMFLPPSSISSSSRSSPETTPVSDNTIFTESMSLNPLVVTSTQRSAQASQTQLTVEHSKTEHSFFPPYQRLPTSASTPFTSSSSSAASAGSTTARSNSPQAAKPHCSTPTQGTSTQEPNSKCRKAMRKSAPPSEPVEVVPEESRVEQVSSSLPSWLNDSLAATTSQWDSSQSQDHIVQRVLKVTPSVHSDDTPFSYMYNVSGQDLLHFSRFTVGQSQLQWAVRYLLHPQHTEDRAGASTQGAADSHVPLV